MIQQFLENSSQLLKDAGQACIRQKEYLFYVIALTHFGMAYLTHKTGENVNNHYSDKQFSRGVFIAGAGAVYQGVKYGINRFFGPAPVDQLPEQAAQQYTHAPTVVDSAPRKTN